VDAAGWAAYEAEPRPGWFASTPAGRAGQPVVVFREHRAITPTRTRTVSRSTCDPKPPGSPTTTCGLPWTPSLVAEMDGGSPAVLRCGPARMFSVVPGWAAGSWRTGDRIADGHVLRARETGVSRRLSHLVSTWAARPLGGAGL